MEVRGRPDEKSLTAICREEVRRAGVRAGEEMEGHAACCRAFRLVEL